MLLFVLFEMQNCSFGDQHLGNHVQSHQVVNLLRILLQCGASRASPTDVIHNDGVFSVQQPRKISGLRHVHGYEAHLNKWIEFFNIILARL